MMNHTDHAIHAMTTNNESPGEFRRIVLDNGLKLVAERHAYVRSVSIGLWVKVGSSDESRSNNGASHFIEHMVFKGTHKRTSEQIATVLESKGGDLNAFTDREFTCFHATVLKEDMALALDVIADIASNPLFDKKHFELERKVLLQELREQDDVPEDFVFDVFAKMVWKNEPLGLPIMGTKKTILGFKLDTLIQFYQDHYCPENMVLSVAGNFEFDSLLKVANEAFSDCGSGQKALPMTRMLSKYQPKRKSEFSKSEQQHVIIGYQATTLTDRERYDALVLCVFLGGGMGSRLFQELREKAALCYTVDVDLIYFSNAGLMTIYSSMDPKSIEKYLEIVSRELQRLKKGIDQSSLDRVKGQVRGSILLSSEVMELRQESLGRNELNYGRYIGVGEVIHTIENVSMENVQCIAEKLLKKKLESVLTVGKKEFKSASLEVL